MQPIKLYAMPLHRLRDLIKIERKRKELTLEQMQALTGIMASNLHDIESGKNKNPGIETLDVLLKALNIKVYTNKDYGGAKAHQAETDEPDDENLSS